MYGSNYQVPEPLRDNVSFLLRVAAERAIEFVDAELTVLGLHSRHAAILVLADNQVLNQNLLAEATKTHPNAVTALIDTLEEKGLAKRQQNPSNRREYLVQVTPSGRKLVRQLRNATNTGLEKFTEHLSTDERMSLTRILLKLVEAWPG